MASINGTFGNDNLTGTLENDSIFGDLGDDILNGGGGDDEFVFNNVNNVLVINSDMYVYSTDGLDIIKNFSGKIISIDPVNPLSKHLDINADVFSQVQPGFGVPNQIHP